MNQPCRTRINLSDSFGIPATTIVGSPPAIALRGNRKVGFFGPKDWFWVITYTILVGSSGLAPSYAQTAPRPGNSSSTTGSFPKAWTRPIEGSILGDAQLLAQSDEALSLLYNMQFSRADSVFDRIEERYPNHPIGPFLKSLTLWWKILPTLSVHDTSLDKAFHSQMEEVIKRSDRLLKRKDYPFDAIFFKTAAHGFRGRLQSDRENWFRAAQEGKSAMKHIFTIAEKDPQNADLLFGIGVYEYFAEAIPERYPVVRPLMFFFPDGDKARGLKQLELAARHGRLVSAEAAYFLLQIYTSFEPEYDKSVEFVTLLREKYPQNALFHVMEGRVYFRWGQWDKAKAIFTDVVSNHSNKHTGYANPLVSQAHYYLGRQDMLSGNDPSAAAHFLEAIKLEGAYKFDSFFRTNATLRAGMASDRMGKRTQAVEFYRKVLKMEDHSNSKDRARKYIKTPYGSDTP
ncbi:MAG: tetratricopeptide repeat protein [Bacteroidetes bacterium]|nr:tetratricopeptide repeat protein [Bacteroidota bacterium]